MMRRDRVPDPKPEKPAPKFLWIDTVPVGWFTSPLGFHIDDPRAELVVSGVKVSTHPQKGWQKVQVIE